MSGNLTPGGDFAPIGTIADYASNLVAPAIDGDPVKAATKKLIKDNFLTVGLPVLIVKISTLVPSP